MHWDQDTTLNTEGEGGTVISGWEQRVCRIVGDVKTHTEEQGKVIYQDALPWSGLSDTSQGLKLGTSLCWEVSQQWQVHPEPVILSHRCGSDTHLHVSKYCYLEKEAKRKIHNVGVCTNRGCSAAPDTAWSSISDPRGCFVGERKRVVFTRISQYLLYLGKIRALSLE